MTIDEAINALQRQLNSKRAFNYKFHADSLALGIEALKYVQRDRIGLADFDIERLPGETEG
jgi:hypothetical protein